MSRIQLAQVAQSIDDRRGSSRAAAILTIGKIAFDGSSRPCTIRDISEGGMRIQMNGPPAIGARVEVEMRGLSPRVASVRWVDGRDAGLAFDQPCDLIELFEARLNRAGHRARPPRFELDHDIGLWVQERRVTARIVNIAVGGAGLVIGEALPTGTHGVIDLNLDLAFDRIAGQVRWTADAVCGFHFARPISSLSLALTLEAWETRVTAIASNGS